MIKEKIFTLLRDFFVSFERLDDAAVGVPEGELVDAVREVVVALKQVGKVYPTARQNAEKVMSFQIR